jgi:hypothetical protein
MRPVPERQLERLERVLGRRARRPAVGDVEHVRQPLEERALSGICRRQALGIRAYSTHDAPSEDQAQAEGGGAQGHAESGDDDHEPAEQRFGAAHAQSL